MSNDDLFNRLVADYNCKGYTNTIDQSKDNTSIGLFNQLVDDGIRYNIERSLMKDQRSLMKDKPIVITTFTSENKMFKPFETVSFEYKPSNDTCTKRMKKR
jgi:hypothetical protein